MNQNQARNEATKRSKRNRGIVYIVVPVNTNDYVVFEEDQYCEEEQVIDSKFENGRMIQG
jgi:hypothetical protein